MDNAQRPRNALGDALGRAMRLKTVSIKPYSPRANITQWLGVFKERVRLISQPLNEEALACYNDLADDVKTDYNRMVTELKVVFGDPSERQDFINNRGKIKSEKGEKTKAFARRIQTAIETNMPELQDDAVGTPNRQRPKELEGVNRFPQFPP
jgi:hypothetical protein